MSTDEKASPVEGTVGPDLEKFARKAQRRFEPRGERNTTTGTADKPRRLENTVRLRVSVSDFPKDWGFSPAMWECWLVGKLKDAGVPVEGTLVFRGIKSGTLTRFDDPEDFGATIYVWEPNGCGDRTWFTAEQWEKLNAWDDVDTYGPSA